MVCAFWNKQLAEVPAGVNLEVGQLMVYALAANRAPLISWELSYLADASHVAAPVVAAEHSGWPDVKLDVTWSN